MRMEKKFEELGRREVLMEIRDWTEWKEGGQKTGMLGV